MWILHKRLAHDGRGIPLATRRSHRKPRSRMPSGLKCRCGTHISILKAVKRAAEMMGRGRGAMTKFERNSALTRRSASLVGALVVSIGAPVSLDIVRRSRRTCRRRETTTDAGSAFIVHRSQRGRQRCSLFRQMDMAMACRSRSHKSSRKNWMFRSARQSLHGRHRQTSVNQGGASGSTGISTR